MCNCDPVGSIEEDCDIMTGQCSCLPTTRGQDCSQCTEGNFNLQSNNPNGCQPCFCSGQSDVCSSASGFFSAQLSTTFNSTAKPPFQGWRLINSSSNGSIPQDVSSPPSDREGILIRADTGLYLEAPANFLGNQLISYSQYIIIEVEPVTVGVNIESTLTYDVILVGSEIMIGTNFSRVQSEFRVHLHESAGWVHIDSSSSLTSREFQLILSSLTQMLISASYNADVVLVSISLDTALNRSVFADTTDMTEVTFVEMCQCPENYTGLSCEACSLGYTRTASGNCELCECNGLSTICDPVAGDCFNCPVFASGRFCESCARGFYGDPVGGVACFPCSCPLTSDAGQFTDECILLDSGDLLCLNCPSGHTGMSVSVQK